MKRFARTLPAAAHEYRLNEDVFYLKFVRRDGLIREGGIVMPVEHFERLQADPTCKGPRGAFRISFDALGGRYLAPSTFLDLLRHGYIGGYAATTQQLHTLVEALLVQGNAVVAAIESVETTDTDEAADAALGLAPVLVD